MCFIGWIVRLIIFCLIIVLVPVVGTVRSGGGSVKTCIDTSTRLLVVGKISEQLFKIVASYFCCACGPMGTGPMAHGPMGTTSDLHSPSFASSGKQSVEIIFPTTRFLSVFLLCTFISWQIMMMIVKRKMGITRHHLRLIFLTHLCCNTHHSYLFFWQQSSNCFNSPCCSLFFQMSGPLLPLPSPHPWHREWVVDASVRRKDWTGLVRSAASWRVWQVQSNQRRIRNNRWYGWNSGRLSSHFRSLSLSLLIYAQKK